MYLDKKIGVIVPARNEEALIGRVIETMPEYVDRIIVVDDASQDATSEIVKAFQEHMGDRLIYIRHDNQSGVGGSIISGHERALEERLDVVGVMAGDAQMDPNDLQKILLPTVEDRADYTKGNRFASGEAWDKMPRIRFFANASLSLLNKIASGHWQIADPQCGYTSITHNALAMINPTKLSRGYQFENSMLVALNINRSRVVDVPVRPVYGIGEKSGISHLWAVFAFSVFLSLAFGRRLWEKYVIRDFHPLVFFYGLGFSLLLIGFVFGISLIAYRIFFGPVESTSALFAAFLFLSGAQFTIFAMWLDKDYPDKVH